MTEPGKRNVFGFLELDPLPDYPTVMVQLTDALRSYICWGREWLDEGRGWGEDPKPETKDEREMRIHLQNVQMLLNEIESWFPPVWPPEENGW
jgi:hypothetical protein